MHAIVTDIIMNVVYVQVNVMGLRVYRVMLIFLFLSDASSVLFTTLIIIGCLPCTSRVAQARNMSIGEHRHCYVTFKYKDLYGKKTSRFSNLRK